MDDPATGLNAGAGDGWPSSIPASPSDAQVGKPPAGTPFVRIFTEFGWANISYPLPLGTTAWHYTDVNGLLGIVKSHTVWATSPSGLNDLSELIYATETTAKKWLDYRDGHTLTTKATTFIEEAIAAAQAADLKRNVYILSACEDGDLLNQWHHYAGRGGYALGLATTLGFDAVSQLTEPDDTPTGQQLPAAWVRVLYDDLHQTTALSEIFDRIAVLADTSPPSESASVSQLCALMLFFLQCRMKHPAFIAEREIRYLASAPTSRQYVAYRIADSRPIPYVVLAPRMAWEGQAARLPIVAVRSSLSAPASEAEIGALMGRYGYDTALVTRSEIPLR